MYVARCLEIDVASQGKTIDESLDNVREALELYLEESSRPVEAPSPMVVAIVEVGRR